MSNNEQNILTITIKYEEAIPLLDFKDILEGINNQYKKQITDTNNENKDDILLIKEIKKSSIELCLISSVYALLSEANNLFSFYTNFKYLVTYLSSMKGTKPVFTSEDVKDIVNIAKTLKSTDRSLHIKTGDNSPVFIVDSVTATKILNNSPSVYEQLEKPPEPPAEQSLNFNNVIIKFEQVNKNETDIKNTKGVISEIDPKKHYPVIFSDTTLKDKIAYGTGNPFKKNYLVDVKVHKENEKIKSYIILAINDSYDDEEMTANDTLYIADD